VGDDIFWTPRIIMIVTIAVTLGFGLVFCVVAFRGLAPQQFHCRRCDRGFRRAAYRRMPARCPHCKAADWKV
jgi:Zn finger protein HypA/HybF involved in hydrogenase expression